MQRSCTAAVTRIASWWAEKGRVVNDTSTGAYCRARKKIPFELVREVSCGLAERAEATINLAEPLSEDQASAMRTPATVADAKGQAVDGRLILVDGFTIDAPDTPENQAAYPQNPAQAEGLGFPILRCVTLTSLASGMVIDMAFAPYSGKETGETWSTCVARLRRCFARSFGPGYWLTI